MDEPTAALGVRETEPVLALKRQLKANGATVILISHNMNDVISVADQATILRAGCTVLSTGVGKLTAEALAQLVLVGRPRARRFIERAASDTLTETFVA